MSDKGHDAYPDGGAIRRALRKLAGRRTANALPDEGDRAVHAGDPHVIEPIEH